MHIIRVVAVGLLLAAGLMVGTALAFFRYWISSEPFNAWVLAFQSISQPVVTASGATFVGIAVFVIACLGLGLLVSTLAYAPIDTYLSRLVDSSQAHAGNGGSGLAVCA